MQGRCSIDTKYDGKIPLVQKASIEFLILSPHLFRSWVEHSGQFLMGRPQEVDIGVPANMRMKYAKLMD